MTSLCISSKTNAYFKTQYQNMKCSQTKFTKYHRPFTKISTGENITKGQFAKVSTCEIQFFLTRENQCSRKTPLGSIYLNCNINTANERGSSKIIVILTQ